MPPAECCRRPRALLHPPLRGAQSAPCNRRRAQAAVTGAWVLVRGRKRRAELHLRPARSGRGRSG
eukprot:scaffold2390_cov280-Prasinococcus_capsulatus_cf.AAC.6